MGSNFSTSASDTGYKYNKLIAPVFILEYFVFLTKFIQTLLYLLLCQLLLLCS